MVSTSTGAERPRGILTPADREFLMASADERNERYTRQARSKRIRAIHERVYNAVLDVSLLVELWPADQRTEVIDELLDQWRGREGLADLITLFYLETAPRNRFDDLFGRGLRRAIRKEKPNEEPTVVSVRPIDEIIAQIERTTIEEAIWKYMEGDRGIWDMTDAEARVLVHLLKYREFSAAEFSELLGNLDRVIYEQYGSDDADRRESWRRYHLHSQDEDY